MKTSVGTENFEPSAIMSPRQAAAWRGLDRDEQLKLVRRVVTRGFESGVSDRSFEDIKARAKARFSESVDK